ncbi:diaminopimelate decarboxylase [Fodinicurvata fenggangensis]|uniref:diaminopimelate decarboxylase n=1 Tax=Fodinicurvata fenggangensis TaxID=1121830 RepID=UPI0004793A6E|nr:diaminopimelate decarboxylase [Fodinicurvata fenggangensis]
MNAFAYRDGSLHAEDLPLAQLIEEVGTPAFIYSQAALESAYRRFASALEGAGLNAQVCYAVKANPHLAVIRTFAELGAGADVVSEGELRRALAAGVPGEKIVFAGVGKSDAEMALGLESGILQFNVESREELRRLDSVARAQGKTAPVALRVNPDVDAKTHAKITTGKSENKFGIDLQDVPGLLHLADDLPGVQIEGLAVHIGSQITQLAPFEAAFQRIADLFTQLRRAGHDLKRLDAGGGLGIAYQGEGLPSVEDYAAVVRRTLGPLEVPLIFEPGRHLVGDAGILLSRVLFVKQGRSRRFVILDAAMNDLLRPALYDAWHDILPLREAGPDMAQKACDVVGPVCESSDVFATGRLLPELGPGDGLAICAAGAYGATMSSTYNSRLPAPEVMVSGKDYSIIRARPGHADLMAQEKLPEWS